MALQADEPDLLHQLAARLLAQIEPLAALSICHLTSSTRKKLADDEMSVSAYPNDYGGFVYVGDPPYAVPTEGDMALIFEVAKLAGIVWLKFDSDAGVIDGLPVFEDDDPVL